MDPDKRRRMREVAEAAARESPGVWRTGEKGPPLHEPRAVTCDTPPEEGPGRRLLLQFNHWFPRDACLQHVVEAQPAAVLALLDALDQAERERDEARERAEKAERLCAARLPTPPDVMGSALKARFCIDLSEAPPARSVPEDD